ncbi:AAA family ATPase [Verrucomicrobium spinosum]|nr:ATP-binding protein [Verrucomicrobium spinosum]
MLIKACLKDHGLKFTELHYHVPGSHEHLKHLTTGGTPRPPTKESITRIAKAIFAMTHPVEGASDATHYNPVALWQDLLRGLNRLGKGKLQEDADERRFCHFLLDLFELNNEPAGERHEPFLERGCILDSRDFHGRAEQLHRLRGQKCGQINGGRKIGKSSLLREAGRKLTNWHPRHAFAYVDMMRADTHTVQGFYAEVASAWGLINSPTSNADFSLCCKEESKKRHLVLVIDEAERFTSLELSQQFDFQFFENLRAVSQQCLTLWFGSKKSLREFAKCSENVSPFNTAPVTLLGLFTPQEAASFLTSVEGVSFDSRESETILHWAGQHPCKLQIACYNVQLKREFGRSLDEAMHDAEIEWNSIKTLEEC